MSHLEWLTDINNTLELSKEVVAGCPECRKQVYRKIENVIAEIDGERETLMRMEEDDE
jgi:tryptophanyl-tRNA synthetase